jgi:hypothetical protein
MATHLDPPPWAATPERALRVAAVVFCAGAAVPSLSCCSLVRMAFASSPAAPWVSAVTTGFFAYWVLRLSPRKAWRAPAVFGLSIVGGAINGLVAGALSGWLTPEPESAIGLALYGAVLGVVYGVAFGVANALLVTVALVTPRPSSMSRGRAVTRLAAAACGLLSLALFTFTAMHDHSFPDWVDRVERTTDSAALALEGSAALTLLAAMVAITSAVAQRRRAHWLARISRGEDPRYRVVPIEGTVAPSSLEVFAHMGGSFNESLIVRVNPATGDAGSAYRQAEHLTPIARLAR